MARWALGVSLCRHDLPYPTLKGNQAPWFEQARTALHALHSSCASQVFQDITNLKSTVTDFSFPLKMVPKETT
jgi:hypothetical protein